MHGDRVRVAILRNRKGAMSHPEGEVVEILERSPQRYVGILELSPNYAFVKVDNRKIPTDIFVPLRNLNGAKDGQKVVVKITDWPLI